MVDGMLLGEMLSPNLSQHVKSAASKLFADSKKPKSAR